MSIRPWMIPGSLCVPSGCQYLEEVREPPATISWSGSVLTALSGDPSTGILSEGRLTLTDLEGNVLAEGSQPYSDSPETWLFAEVPADTEIAIRVESEALQLTPMVWRSRSPSGSALWLTGALFAREASIYEAFFADLDGVDGVTLEPLSDQTVAYLWGEPLDPTAWADTEVVVTDGSGAIAPTIWRFMYTADGSALIPAGAADPVDLLIVPNLAPGNVTLQVDGRVETSWPAQGGDVLSAIFYDLGTSQDGEQ